VTRHVANIDRHLPWRLGRVLGQSKFVHLSK
jgi:hypothetical protein